MTYFKGADKARYVSRMFAELPSFINESIGTARVRWIFSALLPRCIIS